VSKILVGNPLKRHLGDIGVDEEITCLSKCTLSLKELSRRMWTRFVWLGIGTRGGLFGHSDEPYGSHKRHRCFYY
jgi:hypothetical protein